MKKNFTQDAILLCTKHTWNHFNCYSNIAVPCVKNRSKPENLLTQIMWFEKDFKE